MASSIPATPLGSPHQLPASPVMLTTPLPPMVLVAPTTVASPRSSATPTPPSPPPMVAAPLPTTHLVELPYPDPLGKPFRCPLCAVSFKVYTSFTRHLQQRHDGLVSLSFQCDQCSAVYPSKRSVSIHYAKAHVGARDAARHSRPEGGAQPREGGGHVCGYCGDHMPSKRSLGQHIRNRHAAEASRDRARLADNPAAREWTPAEHARFMDGLERYGTSNNRDIAGMVGTKTAKQVSSHKVNFLRNNPLWTTHHPFPPPRSVSPSDPQLDPPPPGGVSVPSRYRSLLRRSSTTEGSTPPSAAYPPRRLTTAAARMRARPADFSPEPASPSSPGAEPLSQLDLFGHITDVESEGGSPGRSPSPPQLRPSSPAMSPQHRALMDRVDAVLDKLTKQLQEEEGEKGETPASDGEGTTPSGAVVRTPDPPSPSYTANCNLYISSPAGSITTPPLPPPVVQRQSTPRPTEGPSGQATAPSMHPDDADPLPPSQHNAGEGEEKLRELRERRMAEFSSVTGHLCGRKLTDEEWSAFEAHVDSLVEDLSQIVHSHPPRHPTTHWQRRRRRQARGNATMADSLPGHPPPELPRRGKRRPSGQVDRHRNSPPHRCRSRPCPNSSLGFTRRTADGVDAVCGGAGPVWPCGCPEVAASLPAG